MNVYVANRIFPNGQMWTEDVYFDRKWAIRSCRDKAKRILNELQVSKLHEGEQLFEIDQGDYYIFSVGRSESLADSVMEIGSFIIKGAPPQSSAQGTE